MSRQDVRDWKRSVSAGLRPQAQAVATQLARECALSLLQRSIGFGHTRLAVMRLALAVETGATVPATHWCYCRNAASSSRDVTMKSLMRRAERAALTANASRSGDPIMDSLTERKGHSNP